MQNCLGPLILLFSTSITSCFCFRVKEGKMDDQRSCLRVYSRKKGKFQQDHKIQETRDYCDLPRDILQSIADGLDFMELLAFRSTCRSWRSASLTCTAISESNSNREPWFLVYGSGSGSPECKLVPESKSKYFTISIPELIGAKCVSSKEGWLLCLREKSMFFFCPFTGAKLNLPDPEFAADDFLAAAFSSDPISPDCSVCALSSAITINGINQVQCWELRRGSIEWTLIGAQVNHHKWEASEGTVFHKGKFYFVSDNDKYFMFDLEERSLSRCGHISYVEVMKSKRTYLPWTRLNYWSVVNKVLGIIGVSQNLNNIPTCGTVVTLDDGKAMIPSGNGKETGSDCLKGVWIQPRLHQVEQELKW